MRMIVNTIRFDLIRPPACLPRAKRTAPLHNGGFDSWVATGWDVSYEDLFVERQRHSRRAQEGAVPAVPRFVPPRYRLSARDQGRARTVRNRPARLP